MAKSNCILLVVILSSCISQTLAQQRNGFEDIPFLGPLLDVLPRLPFFGDILGRGFEEPAPTRNKRSEQPENTGAVPRSTPLGSLLDGRPENQTPNQIKPRKHPENTDIDVLERQFLCERCFRTCNKVQILANACRLSCNEFRCPGELVYFEGRCIDQRYCQIVQGGNFVGWL